MCCSQGKSGKVWNIVYKRANDYYNTLASSDDYNYFKHLQYIYEPYFNTGRNMCGNDVNKILSSKRYITINKFYQGLITEYGKQIDMISKKNAFVMFYSLEIISTYLAIIRNHPSIKEKLRCMFIEIHTIQFVFDENKGYVFHDYAKYNREKVNLSDLSFFCNIKLFDKQKINLISKFSIRYIIDDMPMRDGNKYREINIFSCKDISNIVATNPEYNIIPSHIYNNRTYEIPDFDD